jgi:hypothetical protein
MTQLVQEPPAVVSVAELKRAWLAVRAGQFRCTARLVPRTGPPAGPVDAGWEPAAGDRVLPVLGCTGGCGASTLALALATAATTAARVVECCSPTDSGLIAASTAELGVFEPGWARGTRGEVLIERVSAPLARVEEVPRPGAPDRPVRLTVLDVGWEIGQVLGTGTWLAGQVRDAGRVLLATTATVPGLRRLETTLGLLAPRTVCAAVLGPRRRRWPRPVRHGIGPLTRSLDRAGRLVDLPESRRLAVNGVDTAPLPPALLDATARVLDLLGLCEPAETTGKEARR